MREGNIAGVNENFCADGFGLIAVTAGEREPAPCIRFNFHLQLVINMDGSNCNPATNH